MRRGKRVTELLTRIGCLLAGVVLMASMAAGCSTTESDPGEATMDVRSGRIVGTRSADHLLFQGIPYAAPPTGPLRWRAPEPARPWPGTRDARRPGPVCPQFEHGTGSAIIGSEDCLYLNVTVPGNRKPLRPKPVMVELHGGGFIGGSGSEINARRLSTRGDVVVVTVNYRLGVFGYFGYPGLKDSGGFAFDDQVAALRWVSDNIEAFGGDPDNVTLLGQSAGAYSTCALLTSPRAAPLIDRAIVQSGSCMMSSPKGIVADGVEAESIYIPRQASEQYGRLLADGRLGCGDASDPIGCLRSRPMSALMPIHEQLVTPAFGSDVLPRNPAEALKEGAVTDIPVIIGTTRDEELPRAAMTMTADEYARRLREAFGEPLARRIGDVYSAAGYGGVARAWSALSTDRLWAWPTAVTTGLLARHNPAVFSYEFADPRPPAALARLFGVDPAMAGAFHGSDVASIFPEPGLLDPEQSALSDAMISYWANFARTGDPNGAGLPEWKPTGRPGTTPFTLGFRPGTDGIADVDYRVEHHLDLWDDVAGR